MNDHNFYNYSSIVVLGMLFVLLGIMGYWYFGPVNIINIKNQFAIPVDKTVYHKGDHIIYTFDYCKYKTVAATVNRSLVDHIRINFISYFNNLAPNCAVLHNADLIIPDFVDTGTYHLETTIIYRLNPIRDITIYWRSVDFQIK